MRSLPSFAYNSFLFRLVLFLLVIVTIPLLVLLGVFYHQARLNTESNWEHDVQRIHRETVRRIEAELETAALISKQVVSDYHVQSFFVRQHDPQEEERVRNELALMDRILELKDEYVVKNAMVADICVYVEADQPFSVCSEPQAYKPDESSRPVSRTETVFRLIRNPENWGNLREDILATVISPLYNLSGGAVQGQIVVVVRLGRLLNEIAQENPQMIRHTLNDGAGTVFDYVFGPDGQAAAGKGKAKRTVSEVIVSLPGSNWISTVEMVNTDYLPIWERLRNTAAITVSILLVMSLIASFVFALLITKPLNELRALMKRTEAGDLKAYWDSHGVKEIKDLGISYNQMLVRLEELFQRVKYEEALKKEAQIEALQYQLNPHFLYNTLNTIKWVAKIHKTPQISEVVSSLVRLLQASLGKKGDFLTLGEEISLIKDYMEIQKFRYGDTIKVEYDIDPVAVYCLVPRLILQPLVENAIIHGIGPSGKEGIIRIRAWLERDMLLCEVQDNGVGYQESKKPAGHSLASPVKERMSGIGLNHIRQKINLYYGPDFKLHIFGRPDEGTTVRFSLPIQRSEDEIDERYGRG